jgi:hypothetical protein
MDEMISILHHHIHDNRNIIRMVNTITDIIDIIEDMNGYDGFKIIACYPLYEYNNT